MYIYECIYIHIIYVYVYDIYKTLSLLPGLGSANLARPPPAEQHASECTCGMLDRPGSTGSCSYITLYIYSFLSCFRQQTPRRAAPSFAPLQPSKT